MTEEAAVSKEFLGRDSTQQDLGTIQGLLDEALDCFDGARIEANPSGQRGLAFMLRAMVVLGQVQLRLS